MMRALSEALHDRWQQFREHQPGERFAATYREGRRGQHSAFGHVARLIAGFALSAIGVVLMPAPGPGMLIVLLGLAMLAHESLTVARLLDAAELRLRPPALALLRWWRSRSRGTRLALSVAGAVSGGVTGLLMLQLMRA